MLICLLVSYFSDSDEDIDIEVDLLKRLKVMIKIVF